MKNMEWSAAQTTVHAKLIFFFNHICLYFFNLQRSFIFGGESFHLKTFRKSLRWKIKLKMATFNVLSLTRKHKCELLVKTSYCELNSSCTRKVLISMCRSYRVLTQLLHTILYSFKVNSSYKPYIQGNHSPVIFR